MKIKAIRLMLAFCTMLAVVQVFACAAITKKGTLCKRAPSPGSQYCWQHGGTTAAQRAAGLTEADVAKMRCKATTKAGTQCKRTAKPGTDFCWQHAAMKGVVVSDEPRKACKSVAHDVDEQVTTPAGRVQCDAITKSGARCTRKALSGGTKCWQHAK